MTYPTADAETFSLDIPYPFSGKILYRWLFWNDQYKELWDKYSDTYGLDPGVNGVTAESINELSVAQSSDFGTIRDPYPGTVTSTLWQFAYASWPDTNPPPSTPDQWKQYLSAQAWSLAQGMTYAMLLQITILRLTKGYFGRPVGS